MFSLKDIKYQFENGKHKLDHPCVSSCAHCQNETFAMSHPHILFQKLLQLLRGRIKDTVCLLCYLSITYK